VSGRIKQVDLAHDPVPAVATTEIPNMRSITEQDDTSAVFKHQYVLFSSVHAIGAAQVL
jgi:hypothetical protein